MSDVDIIAIAKCAIVYVCDNVPLRTLLVDKPKGRKVRLIIGHEVIHDAIMCHGGLPPGVRKIDVPPGIWGTPAFDEWVLSGFKMTCQPDPACPA